jgi:LAS superfamily LD-carboxypeptidase LdcB
MFEGLQPWLRPYAIWFYQVAQHYGLQPRVTSVFRSWEKQRMLRERWERGESQLYAARPGESKHQYGLAFDMVSRDNTALGNLWKQMGGKWWESDYPHFEV